MKRLDEDKKHSAVHQKMAEWNSDIVAEVAAAVEANDVVVVGMALNPHPKQAKKILDGLGIAYKYLEYGSYATTWYPRLALKMWAGWPTFPMVFVKGQLIGGASDLKQLADNGELRQLLDS